MGLAEALGVTLRLRHAFVFAFAVALLGTSLAMPKILRKLKGAGIVGRDINKPDRPEVPEMGGIGVFLGTYAGVFAFLLAYPLTAEEHVVVLVALITAAGAAMTGIMDDLVELRQRFKAFIPVVFAAPLAVYVTEYTVDFPVVGPVDFGLVYPLLLVPLGITCAANGFNMLEGYNGLGAGVGVVSAAALSVLVVLEGRPIALVILAPLLGALLAFLWFNKYPAKVFPGDTMTLFVGALLAAAAMIGKVEFWGALLFLPHVVEFVLKARGHFKAENFAKRVVDDAGGPPRLEYDGPTESVTHVLLKRGNMTEPRISATLWAMQAALALAVVAAYLAA